jgi:hypothetical protein
VLSLSAIAVPRRPDQQLRWIAGVAHVNIASVGSYERSSTVEAAQVILDHGGWCVYEACLDVPEQRWEPRVVIFKRSADAVANAIELEVESEPFYDARLTGCDRLTLAPAPGMGAYLCYLADAPL